MKNVMIEIDGVPSIYFLRSRIAEMNLSLELFSSIDDQAEYCLDAADYMPSGSVVLNAAGKLAVVGLSTRGVV